MVHEVPNCHYAFESGLPFPVIEHSTYFTPESLSRLVTSAGCKVGELQVTPGFLRMIATKTRDIKRLLLDQKDRQDLLTRDLTIAQQYVGRFKEYTELIDTHIEEARTSVEGRIAVYGAGYFFTNLVNFTKLDLEEIAFVCDSNPAKWGIVIPGLNEPVQAPTHISYPEIQLVIIATMSYQEILSRLNEYLGLGGNALYFAPQPTLFHP